LSRFHLKGGHSELGGRGDLKLNSGLSLYASTSFIARRTTTDADQKPSRARKWLKSGKAKVVYNDLGIFTVQLVSEPSDTKTQPISVGVDPGKKYTGIGVQSAKVTLWMAHLQLPFETVKGRMEQRRMMRRGRRGRRINRKVPYNQRAHRQARFDNRRQKSSAIHPSQQTIRTASN
jgi:hypothetical protein